VTDHRLRPAVAEDADEIDRLYRQSAEHLQSLGDPGPHRFNAALFRRDGFGPHPAFSGVVAEGARGLAGYLLYTTGYDTDRGIRTVFVVDLLVDRERRRRGIGRALMSRAADLCREAGGGEVRFAVFAANRAALEFYRALGAIEDPSLRYFAVAVPPSSSSE
jgi:ribosomal protein S18 acetylase RimI-like enzyme